MRSRSLLTPCSSSFISWSVTLGVLSARRRQCTLSSGTRYSRTSLSGRPRARPCLDVEGTASSRMEPLRVLSCNAAQADGERKKTEKREGEGGLRIMTTVFVQRREQHRLPWCQFSNNLWKLVAPFNYVDVLQRVCTVQGAGRKLAVLLACSDLAAWWGGVQSFIEGSSRTLNLVMWFIDCWVQQFWTNNLPLTIKKKQFISKCINWKHLNWFHQIVI